MKKEAHIIYESIYDWYHEEIDYDEMLDNLRYTKSGIAELMRETYPLVHFDLFHHAGCYSPDRKRKQLFQFWNKQYNDAIANAIKACSPNLVIDICAGDGRLAKVLSARGINIKATDDLSWNLQPQFFEIEKLDYREAIEKYKPDFVIGCWMENGTDYTPDFRNAESVNHYMIIGELGGCCGGDYNEQVGWERKEVREANKYGLSRVDTFWMNPITDEINSLFGHRSEVLLFSRK